MADSKESFEILENGSGDGVAATSAQIGDAGGGKIGMAVFPFRDASGNLRMPEVNGSNHLKTDGSSYTQPISAASLPLPSGAATSTNQTTANASLSSIDSKLTNPLPVSGTVSATQGTSPWVVAGLSATGAAPANNPVPVSGVDGGGLKRHLLTDTDGTQVSNITKYGGTATTLGQKVMASSIPVTLASDQSNVPAGVSIGNNYTPTTPYTQVTVGKLMTDPDNQLLIRGDVLTDEGTFRDDFSGSNLSNQRWTTQQSTSGSSITVGSSLVNLISGTSNNARAVIQAPGDYGPISLRTQFSVSQRIANQVMRVGFADSFTNPTTVAYFQFSGTDNTKVDCITSSSSAASDTQTTTVTIINGTSASSNDYYVEIQPDQVTFLINGVPVAQNRLHVPGPYDVVNAGALINNTAVAASSTTISLDYFYFINQNALQVTNSFEGDPAAVRVKQGTVVTYAAAATDITPAGSATDVFTITGSATKTVKIKNIIVTSTRTTATNTNILLVKRSTANTAGTSTTPSIIPYESSDPAATAVVRAYTANPTVGTAVGTVYSAKVFLSTSTTVGNSFIFARGDDMNVKDITLKSASEVLAVNLNGVTVTGGVLSCTIVWTEE